jgi:hypothetical protein
MPSAPPLGFVFDEHVNGVALRRLRSRGVDVVHVAEAGLSGAPDARIVPDLVTSRGLPIEFERFAR